jgi:hypothetical protein
MIDFPETDQKLKRRISSYKSVMNREKRDHGAINDGRGKRYVLFSLYFLLGDDEAFQKYSRWYVSEFPDDVQEPIQLLCWSIMAFRAGSLRNAKFLLAKLIVSNVYMVPSIIGRDVLEKEIWHSTNNTRIDYIGEIPKKVRDNISDSDIDWIKKSYDSFEFRRVRKRHLDIYSELLTTGFGERRRLDLIDESRDLLNMLQ